MGVTDEFYTVQEIADLLRISLKTARELVNTDGFPALRFGKTIRIPKQKFDIWVNSYTGKEFFI